MRVYQKRSPASHVACAFPSLRSNDPTAYTAFPASSADPNDEPAFPASSRKFEDPPFVSTGQKKTGHAFTSAASSRSFSGLHTSAAPNPAPRNAALPPARPRCWTSPAGPSPSPRSPRGRWPPPRRRRTHAAALPSPSPHCRSALDGSDLRRGPSFLLPTTLHGSGDPTLCRATMAALHAAKP
jgi:hypothetical protein